MGNQTFSFSKQLKQGNIGEEYFINCYNSLNPVKSSYREVDIIINGHEIVELKTDSYALDDTPNLFLESISNTKNGKLGGPFLSVQNDVNWFVYLYIKNKTFFWFSPKELVDFIEKNSSTLKQKEIKNYGWSSIGFLVNRELVKHLVKRQDTFK